MFSARIHQLLNHKAIDIYILGSPINIRFEISNYLGSNINTLFEILEGRYFNKQISLSLFILGTSYLMDFINIYSVTKNVYNEYINILYPLKTLLRGAID